MYISKIEISNYRNFRNTTNKFNDGVNVIIGHNNAGKKNILNALGLVFERSAMKKLSIDDFCKQTVDFSTPAKITVSVTLKESAQLVFSCKI